MKTKKLYCAIIGKTVNTLPFGMDEGDPDCTALKLALLSKTAEISAAGIKDFYCNCEYGASMFAAEAVCAIKDNHGIRLHIVMPFEGQANKYSREVRDRFFHLHETAESVKILNTQFNENCYCDADRYMVDNSSLLLTDNKDSFAARYAAGQNVRIELIGKIPAGILL